MVELSACLKEYVRADVLFTDRLLDRLIRELNLSDLEHGIYLYYGEKLEEVENVLWGKLSSAKSHLEVDLLLERAIGQLAENFDLTAEEVFLRRGLPVQGYLVLVHTPNGLAIAIHAGVVDALLELETKNVARELIARFGGKLEGVKTEEELWAFFKRHSNLLEELYIDESKSFESFVEAIKEAENTIADEVAHLKPQDLTGGSEHDLKGVSSAKLRR